MFSNATIAIVFGIGLSAWVYNKAQQRTGGNTQTALLVAGFCAVIGALVIFTILGIIF